MLLHSSEGFAALLTDQIKSARRAFRDQLELCRAFVMLPLASDGLAGLAAVAFLLGDLERAARLAASAGALRGHRIEDRLDVTLDRNFFEPARGRHTPAAWDAAAAEGTALEIEAAIAYALDDARGQAQSSFLALDRHNQHTRRASRRARRQYSDAEVAGRKPDVIPQARTQT